MAFWVFKLVAAVLNIAAIFVVVVSNIAAIVIKGVFSK